MIAGFDYSTCTTEQTGKLEYYAKQVKSLRIKHMEILMAMGEALLGAQQLLSQHHTGTFAAWCEKACGISKSTAYNIIAGYELMAPKQEVAEQFEPSATYELGKKSAPRQAVKAAFALAERGTVVTKKVAQNLIEKHRPPKAQPQPPAPEEQVAEHNELQAAMKKLHDVLQRCATKYGDKYAAAFKILRNLEGTVDNSDLEWRQSANPRYPEQLDTHEFHECWQAFEAAHIEKRGTPMTEGARQMHFKDLLPLGALGAARAVQAGTINNWARFNHDGASKAAKPRTTEDASRKINDILDRMVAEEQEQNRESATVQ